MKRGGTIRRQKQSGQSTLEFALTMILILAFVLGFVQISLVLGFGNFVHYATFMAARAELSAGPNEQDQFDRARDVIVKLLKKSVTQPNTDRWPALGRAQGGSDVPGAQFNDDPRYTADPAFSWLQGVRYTFKSRLFMIPVGGDASTQTITLTSESWLGREPNYQDCVQVLSKGWLFDNGC